MRATVISFSGRVNGNCHNIARFITESLPSGYNANLFEMGGVSISPCGGCGYECFDADKKCPYTKDDIGAIYHSVVTSEIAYYVVPNYCGYPNANFFIFNERGQGYFQHKPSLTERYRGVKKKFIVVSNTDVENFIPAFKEHVAEDKEPDALVLSAKAFGKISLNGDLMESEQVKHELDKFILH